VPLMSRFLCIQTPNLEFVTYTVNLARRDPQPRGNPCVVLLMTPPDSCYSPNVYAGNTGLMPGLKGYRRRWHE